MVELLSPPSPGLHLLFVDEEPLVLQTFTRAVRRSCDAVAVSDARTAIRALGAVGPFDAVIANFVLPNGWALALLAAAHRRCPGTLRVLLATEPADPVITAALARRDVNLVLVTPCAPSELLRAIRAARSGDESLHDRAA
jgi:DNA-binding NarL/FixJ family response regulator